MNACPHPQKIYPKQKEGKKEQITDNLQASSPATGQENHADSSPGKLENLPSQHIAWYQIQDNKA